MFFSKDAGFVIAATRTFRHLRKKSVAKRQKKSNDVKMKIMCVCVSGSFDISDVL